VQTHYSIGVGKGNRILSLIAAALAVLILPPAYAQNAPDPLALPPPSVDEKWNYFIHETFSPLTIFAGAFTAAQTQIGNANPRYGVGSAAYAKRFGAAIGDEITQNFFSDFVIASALHQDTRYRRLGPPHGFWHRVGYAISRAAVTQTDAGAKAVNWSNFLGTALSVGLSNAYYPAASRTARVTAINWGASTAGVGFANMAPEFLPDIKAWLKRHHP
jgi:hypothetical protein